MKLIGTLEVNNQLGEGIIWDSSRRCVWWTDILQSSLYRYTIGPNKLEQWDTPERLCCFAPTQKQTVLTCAFESGFAFYQPETGEIEWVQRLEQDNPGTRFNDGRTDRQGRLWAGTMVEDPETASYQGSLYCLHPNLRVSKTITGLSITNSLCWSPDGNTVYHTDTPTRIIKRYDFAPYNASMTNPTTLVKTERGCYPDGSTVDSEGYLWNAQWGGSKVVRYSPTGDTNLEIIIPTSQPTCVTFAGDNLDLLFVTTASDGLNDTAAGAGDVYIYQSNFKGIADTPFLRA